MYRWEIRWEEGTFERFKGFKTKESYDKFKKCLEKRGLKITGIIEDGRKVFPFKIGQSIYAYMSDED